MVKPPTEKMTEVLMDCHEREILNLEPYDVAMVPSVSGLILRGMVTTKAYITKKGKKILALFITHKGKSYLKNI